jgi:hypothetical protein
MANHSYVTTPSPLTGEAAEQLLQDVVRHLWDSRLVVKSYVGVDTTPGRLSWEVYLPNSGMTDDHRAMVYGKAPDDDFGFMVWYNTLNGLWEFRHPHNSWERWAQDKVQHTIARRMGVSTYVDDGTSKPLKVDPDELRDTFRQYVVRNFKEPYKAADLEWFKRCLSYAPEGFRE